MREDYSTYGTAWEYFTHDQSRSRAYRWGEDGIGGISDNHQQLCFAISLWNGNDPIIKERLFGLTGNEGNHGEDVKEYYFYLDNIPTHSYMKYLYKYPQTAFPYTKLVYENSYRSRKDSEYELLDTGIFNENRYFDIFIEYSKNTPDDILIKVSAVNRGNDAATLHLIPTIWFRNTWSWSSDHRKPSLSLISFDKNSKVIEASHETLFNRWLYFQEPKEILFTENETNKQKLFGVNNSSIYVKDGINEYIVNGVSDAVNPNGTGTKAGLVYVIEVAPGATEVVKLRLSDLNKHYDPFGSEFEKVFENRKRDADEFYKNLCPFSLTDEMRNIQRQALAGMLWNKQFYSYIVTDWLSGDPSEPMPPQERKNGRNHNWFHFYSDDIISMPDKWEYPWFATWDLAFHTIPLVMIDPEFAKSQLILLVREWYMHPNGQIPAYEWAFGDVNPPVHAWATWRIYNIEKKIYGVEDFYFLERVFQKLLLNFTWWVNRKDSGGRNIFEGGFLGLDNVGVLDRSAPLPTGGYIEQADGTSWMGMYCLNMLAITLELAKKNPSYEDMASKFFEHFLYIADAINKIGGEKKGLWNEEDKFYYDVLHLSENHNLPMKVRSVVGLIPIFAVETLEPSTLKTLPGFKKRFDWFIKNRPDLRMNVACMETEGIGARRLLSIVNQDKLKQILSRMLDENEFLGPYGIRSLSKYHDTNPYFFEINGYESCLAYDPAESTSGLFGGNSNWRGPIWFPLNFLIIESLQKFHFYFGDNFKVECPAGSGVYMTLWEVADELSKRLMSIFLKDSSGKRPLFGCSEKFQTDPHWKDLILFSEYFHGENGSGIGANHQTGWTGLVAKLIQQYGEYTLQGKKPDLFSNKMIRDKSEIETSKNLGKSLKL